MPQNIQAMRERRAALSNQLQNLIDKEKTPVWGAPQQEQYDAAMREVDEINASIERHEATMRVIADSVADSGGITDDDRNAFTRTPGAHNAETRALRAYLSGGLLAVAPEDLRQMRARQPLEMQNAMSTTTGSEGGYTVASEYYRVLTEAMRQFGGIRSVASIIQAGSGGQMNFPTSDATTEEGEIVGQNAPVTTLGTVFGNRSVDTYKYSSKAIAVPIELIQDSMFDIEAWINKLLALRLGRITSRHFTVGDGVSKPYGLITEAGAGKVGATGQTLSVTYDDLVDLEHSVDPVYRQGNGVGFMMHDQSLKVVRKIKDTTGRPIFVPGYDQGNPGGAPDRLLNRSLIISQEMPQMAANAKSIAFGDFSKYLIREVMDLTLFRMADSAFIMNGQIGFIAFNRMGGRLIDVGGAVKTYANSAS